MIRNARETVIIFHKTPLCHDEMRHRVVSLLDTHMWLVDETNGEITGYTYACPWKARSAYRHVVETSV